jgi:hypothetical protein
LLSLKVMRQCIFSICGIEAHNMEQIEQQSETGG